MANILLLLAVIFHAWIGAWTVITDYVNPPLLRLLAKLLLWLFLFGCFIYGMLVFTTLFW